ncbi:MAG: class I SAM-dependent methyltransferase [Bryobacteraceae bacterium]
MSSQHIQATDALVDYIRSVSHPEPDLLRRLREETAADPMARMQITPEQGWLLRLLVGLIGARRTIEIGVFTGYSSTSVALALPPGGKITACDVSDKWTSVARRYWREAGVEEKIDLHLAPARDTLDSLLAAGSAGSYDFAFIDADKTGYADYYDRCFELLRPGGLIAVDNTLWYARVIDDSVQDADTVALRAFNKKLAADLRIDLILLPVGDGLTLARKRG